MAVRAKTKSAKRRTRDREATQLALIAAAETIFAEHGYKGATLDLLAEETGANKALVSYYFGSKDGLYDAVIASMASDVVADVKAQMEETGDPAKDFKQYVHALARAFAARPTFGAILMREYIGGTMQEREGPFQQVFQFFRMTEKLYKDGRRKKAFRKFDPHLLHLSIVGPLIHFTLTMGFRERTFEKLASDVENPTVEAFAAHLADLLLDGLR